MRFSALSARNARVIAARMEQFMAGCERTGTIHAEITDALRKALVCALESAQLLEQIAEDPDSAHGARLPGP